MILKWEIKIKNYNVWNVFEMDASRLYCEFFLPF